VLTTILQVANDLRKAVPEFREKYGEAATVGAEEWILEEFMPSEHSDCGEVDPEVFQNHMKAMGGGKNGWEVRPKAWHSEKVSVCCYRIGRIFTMHQKRHFIGALKTIQSRRRTGAIGDKRSNSGHARVARFRAMKENINKKPPPADLKLLPYASMVNPIWKAAYEAKENTIVPTLPDPPHFTIAHLDIPLEDLDDDERGYFGDYEY
jgi:hypothetical protein